MTWVQGCSPPEMEPRIPPQAHFLCYSRPLWSDPVSGSLWFPSPQQQLLFCSVFFSLSSGAAMGVGLLTTLSSFSSSAPTFSGACKVPSGDTARCHFPSPAVDIWLTHY